jgi:hypothetical protein
MECEFATALVIYIILKKMSLLMHIHFKMSIRNVYSFLNIHEKASLLFQPRCFKQVLFVRVPKILEAKMGKRRCR